MGQHHGDTGDDDDGNGHVHQFDKREALVFALFAHVWFILSLGSEGVTPYDKRGATTRKVALPKRSITKTHY